MAVQATINVGRLAEQIWWMLTEGTPGSLPSKREVQLVTEQDANYWGKREMYEKYKLEAQWITHSRYIVPFYGMELIANPEDMYSKMVTMPFKQMDLPKERGIDRVTYSIGGTGRKTQIRMRRLSIRQMDNPGGLGRMVGDTDYFYTLLGDKIIVKGRCATDPVLINTINAFPVMINDDNMDVALQAIVISEVLKKFRGYSPKDDIADQNNKMLAPR